MPGGAYRATVGKLGVGFAARRINRQPDNVAKVDDAMDLIREKAGQLEGFEFLMVLLRYHMVVHDVAEMPQLNEATRRLGFFLLGDILSAVYTGARIRPDVYSQPPAGHRRHCQR